MEPTKSVAGNGEPGHRLQRTVLPDSQRRHSVIKHIAGQQILIAGSEGQCVDGAGAAAGEGRSRNRRQAAIRRHNESIDQIRTSAGNKHAVARAIAVHRRRCAVGKKGRTKDRCETSVGINRINAYCIHRLQADQKELSVGGNFHAFRKRAAIQGRTCGFCKSAVGSDVKSADES